MKKAITLLFLVLSTTVWSQKKITISFDKDIPAGQKQPNGYNFDTYLLQNLITYKIDTLTVVNGKISISNKTKTITPYAVARMKPRQAVIVFVEPKSDFRITLSEPQLAIKSSKGSKSQADYLKFMQEQGVIQKQTQIAQGAMPKVKNKDSLRNRIKFLQMKMNQKYIEFVNYQQDNNLGAYIVFDVANKNQKIPAADLKGLFDKLAPKGKKSYFGKQIENRIKRLTAMDVGNTAPDFTLMDKNGKKHTLSSLRGKYVLVDFWASWCGPCVREIPHLKVAYQKYHDKGFEIMSVSIDRKRGQWLKALEKYKMPWISVVDNQDVAKKITQTLYYVPTIPRTILLDKKGKVIGKDFRGVTLENTLAELFKTQ